MFKNRARSLRELLERSAALRRTRSTSSTRGGASATPRTSRAVASVARALEERFGVGPGDRVAILAANCPEWVLAFWAATSLGAVAVGLNGWWAGRRDPLRRARRGAEAPDRRPQAPGAPRGRRPGRAGRRDRERLRRAPRAMRPTRRSPPSPIAEDDPACILYTSGTTGGRRAPSAPTAAILALVTLNLFNGARGMLAARGARRRRAPRGAAAAPALRPRDDAVLPRLGPLHRRGHDARGRRAHGAARRPLRSRRRDAPHRARAGDELGADGHDGLPRRAPSRARALRPLERRADRLRRRADAPGSPGAHPRGVPERAAQPRPRLRAHRVGRARHGLLRRGAARASRTRSGGRSRRSSSRSATPHGRRAARGRARARSTSAARS